MQHENRFIMNLLAIGLLTMLAPFFCTDTAIAEKTILRFANFFPPTHAQSILSETWSREVEKRTEGRVRVQFFPGETLSKARQTYDDVINGVVDVGLSCLAYTRGRFPLLAALDLPFGYSSGMAATATANYIYEKYKPAEFDDTQVMFLHAHGPGLIHARGKPVKTLEDMQGLKIRSTGLSSEVVKALGATPVSMAMPEAYQSLQRGTVDGSANPFEALKGFSLAEVIDFSTYSSSVAYTTTFFVVMNKKRWNALNPRDQAIIEEINAEWAVKHGLSWDEIDSEALRYLLEQGKTIVGLGERERARWKKAVEPLFQNYVSQTKALNLEGQLIIDAIWDYLKTTGN